jgi:hypothetical protein
MMRTPASMAAEAAFRARLADLGATLLEPAWLGSAVRHRVRCAEGHDCAPMPTSVRRGQGVCQACGGNSPAAAEAAFRARLAELGATLLEPAWLGANSRHRVRCAAGHESAPRPANVQQGHGVCLACVGNDAARAEAVFRARLAELGATLLEPAWLGTAVRHRIRCAAGHESAPLPGNLRRGQGICKTCLGNDSAIAEAAFRCRLVKLGAELLEPAWLGADKRHRVRCAAGHDCAPRPAYINQGGAPCRKCSGRAWDAFYVVTADLAGRVKFGITSGDARVRLDRHRSAGYRTVIRLLTGLPADTAVQMEQAAIATLALAGIKPVHGREWFDIGALAVVLDVTDNWNGGTN